MTLLPAVQRGRELTCDWLHEGRAIDVFAGAACCNRNHFVAPYTESVTRRASIACSLSIGVGMADRCLGSAHLIHHIALRVADLWPGQTLITKMRGFCLGRELQSK